jgi:hypothetical protein
MKAVSCRCSEKTGRIPTADRAAIVSVPSHSAARALATQDARKPLACARSRRMAGIDVQARRLTNIMRKCTQSGLEFNLQSALAFVRNSLYRTRRFHGLRAEAALRRSPTLPIAAIQNAESAGRKGGFRVAGTVKRKVWETIRTAHAHRRGDARHGFATTTELGGTT